MRLITMQLLDIVYDMVIGQNPISNEEKEGIIWSSAPLFRHLQLGPQKNIKTLSASTAALPGPWAWKQNF